MHHKSALRLTLVVLLTLAASSAGLLSPRSACAKVVNVTASGGISFISPPLLPAFAYGQRVVVFFSFDDATPIGFQPGPQSADFFAIDSLVVLTTGFCAVGVYPESLGPIELVNDLPQLGGFVDEWNWGAVRLEGSAIGIYSPETADGSQGVINSVDLGNPSIPPSFLNSTSLTQPVPFQPGHVPAGFEVVFRTPTESSAAYFRVPIDTLTTTVPEPDGVAALLFGTAATALWARRARRCVGQPALITRLDARRLVVRGASAPPAAGAIPSMSNPTIFNPRGKSK